MRWSPEPKINIDDTQRELNDLMRTGNYELTGKIEDLNRSVTSTANAVITRFESAAKNDIRSQAESFPLTQEDAQYMFDGVTQYKAKIADRANVRREFLTESVDMYKELMAVEMRDLFREINDDTFNDVRTYILRRDSSMENKLEKSHD